MDCSLAMHDANPDRVKACDGTAMVTSEELPFWMKEHSSPFITQEYVSVSLCPPARPRFDRDRFIHSRRKECTNLLCGGGALLCVFCSYRLCSTYWSAFLSLFYLHNCWLDTVTALFNMIHASILYVWLRFAGTMDLSGEDHFVFGMFYLTCIMHSPPSILYHLVGCAGKSLWDFLFFQRFDFLFIFVSSIPLSISLGYYALYYQPVLMAVSVFGVIACAGYCLWVISTPFDAARRVIMIGCLVFFYTIPVFYVIISHLVQGHFESPGVWWGVAIIVSLSIGAYLYAIKYPECSYPDCFWTSHSLMHLTVNAAYFCEFGFIVAAYHWHYSPGTERAFDSWYVVF